MAGKSVSIAVLIMVFTGLASSLTFYVDIDEVTEFDFKDFEHSDNVEVEQEVSGNLENTGSIGCSYRLRGDFSYNNETFERYSAPVSLWQGAQQDVELSFIPMNYTGLVDAQLYVEYCDQEERVEEFSFNVTENTLPGASMDSRTRNVNSSAADIEIESGDKLVPEETPSFWKASSAEIDEGEATVEYEAPIFTDQETLSYTVLENGSVKGSVDVDLEEEPNLKEKLVEKRVEILSGLLLLSVAVNLGLFASRRVDFKVPEFDLPDFRKQE